MKKISLALAASAMTFTGLAISAPAAADPPRWAPAHGYRDKHDNISYRRTNDGIRYWEGRDGRYYCRKGDGTVGLLIGGAAGALVGRAIDTRGERATGTILGAAAGALLGKKVAEGRNRCR
ncbi:glycine zipper 2TM domain-containing protein [Altererythrobacter sp. CAU 1778]